MVLRSASMRAFLLVPNLSLPTTTTLELSKRFGSALSCGSASTRFLRETNNNNIERSLVQLGGGTNCSRKRLIGKINSSLEQNRLEIPVKKTIVSSRAILRNMNKHESTSTFSKVHPNAAVKSLAGDGEKTAKADTLTLAVVGDVHNDWNEEDELALNYLNPDVVAFVGDIGNENVELIERIASLPHRKVVILGNHDAWYSLTERGKKRALRIALSSSSMKNFTDAEADRVQQSLTALGSSHVGYAASPMEDLGLVFVGGRPFSKGGMEWSMVKKFYDKYYGIASFEDSSSKILEHILDQDVAHLNLIMVAHNGPAGLGDCPEDPCGIDFMEPADDFGDPDLEDALETAKTCGRHAKLVLFGHMHHTLKKGGYRNMVEVDEDSGTIYLNAAVVPRVKKFKREASKEGEDAWEGKCRHFLLVEMNNGDVQNAKNTWVAHRAKCSNTDFEIIEEQYILRRAESSDASASHVMSYYKAYSDTWDHKIIHME